MESGTDSEENSIYEKLHEQFETYKTYFKSNKTPEVPEEEDAPVTLEFETKCKGLLEEMLESVNTKLENVGPSEAEFLRLLALKCAITFEKGRTFAQFGDDELGLKAMEEALLLSAHHRQLPELSYLVLKIYNTSSYLESRSEKYEKAYITLQEASTFYRQITNGDVGDFYTVDDLFSEDSVITPKAESKTLLERLMTNNLQLLSFVSHKVGRVEDYFKCTHEMLERQLRDTENQPLLWALKVGRLAFGFVTQTRFWEARNHLAAAFHILNNYAEQLKKDGVEETATKSETLKHTEADMAKLWVKYCLYILSASKKRLLTAYYAEANEFVENMWTPKNGAGEEAGDEPPVLPTDAEVPSNIVKNEEPESQQPDEEPSSNPEKEKELERNEEECPSTNETKTDEDISSRYKEDELNEIPRENLLLFTTLDLRDLEDQVTANIVENTEQARAVVMFAHAWLRRSKAHFTINQYPIEYINGILDLSDLYKYLAFFEEDTESQYMVQKSRADALETLNIALRELRPPCLITVTIELLRELAEVQLELVGLNLRRLFSINRTHEEGGSELSPSEMLQKMGALTDLHGRLEHFGDSFEFITQPRFFETANETLQQCT